MKQKIIGLTLLLLISIAGFWGITNAQEFRSGNTSSVEPGETIDSTLWISGRTVDIAGDVNGDVFCAGQHVTVSGSIQGDLLCAAQTIVVSGEVGGNVRAAAQSLTLNGDVTRNVSVLSQNFNQGPNSTVSGDVSIAGGDAVLNGNVGRDVAMSSGAIRLNGEVGRNVQAVTSSLSLGSGAAIAGNLNYTSQSDAKIARGATVEGKITKTEPKPAKDQGAGNKLGKAIGSFLYSSAAALLITLLFTLLFPQAIHAITDNGLRSFWKALLVGLVAVVVVPVAIIIAMLTIIGIPLGVILLLGSLVTHVLAITAAAYLLGRVVWRGQRNALLIMLLGTVLLVILFLIPVLGLLVWLTASLVGTGMLLIELWHRRPKARYDLETRPDSAR